MCRLGTEKLENDLLPSDLAERIKQLANCLRHWYQQLGIRWGGSPWPSLEKGDEGITKFWDELIQVGIEELGVILVWIKLYTTVSYSLIQRASNASLPGSQVYLYPSTALGV